MEKIIFCFFLPLVAFSYYIDREYPLCKATDEIFDIEKSCIQGYSHKTLTIDKILEMICFQNLNNLIESNLGEDTFFNFFIAERKTILYSKEGIIYYTNCSNAKIMEIKELTNFSSCSNDLEVVYRLNNQDAIGYLTSSGILRESEQLEPCSNNSKFSFFHFNNQEFIKYKNIVKIRVLNSILKPVNLSDVYKTNNSDNELFSIYENVFFDTKASIIKDLFIFFVILTLFIVRFRKNIKKLFANKCIKRQIFKRRRSSSSSNNTVQNPIIASSANQESTIKNEVPVLEPSQVEIIQTKTQFVEPSNPDVQNQTQHQHPETQPPRSQIQIVAQNDSYNQANKPHLIEATIQTDYLFSSSENNLSCTQDFKKDETTGGTTNENLSALREEHRSQLQNMSCPTLLMMLANTAELVKAATQNINQHECEIQNKPKEYLMRPRTKVTKK